MEVHRKSMDFINSMEVRGKSLEIRGKSMEILVGP
jgi:hypothetical protein